MKTKKYITTGIVIGILFLAGGAVYHFYPNTIKNIVSSIGETNDATEIDAVQYDMTSSTDDVAQDDASHAGNASVSGSDAPSGDTSTVSTITPGDNDGDISITTSSAISELSQSPSPTATTDTSPMIISSSTVDSPSCSFPADVPSTTQKVLLNEIAWMGSASSSDAEWMELKNISANDIDLSGWELLNASGKIKIIFSEGDAIPANGFFLLSRGTADAAASSDAMSANEKIYSGGLANTGDVLALIDPQCAVSDYLDASQGWPGGNNTTKQTLERGTDGEGWHTSALPGGTPDAENSAGPPPAQYKLTIDFEGAGPDSVVSDPTGLVCGASCTGSYASGTQVTLTPTPGKSAAFSGWSGLCYGETVCSFTIAATTSLTANFHSMIVLPSSGAVGSSTMGPSTQPPPSTPTSTGGTDVPTTTGNPALSSNVLISAVQIASASSSSNDFVALYNPTGVTVDMSGWKLRKKSQTGADYSIKEFPGGSLIPAGQSFTWANSANGFSETVGANVSSTETLSADNSIALIDANGTIIDAVAWGTGTGQYGEGSPYPTDPTAGQVLVRQSAGGVMLDTENNASDFILH